MKEVRDRDAGYEPIERNPLEHRSNRLVLSILHFLVRLFWRVEYRGLDHIPEKGPLLVACNHQSLLDVPVMLTKIKPWIYMVAKEELFRHWPLRKFLYWFASFPVNREKMSMKTAKRIMTVLGRGDFLGMYPEGTRVKRKSKPEDVRPHPGVVYFARRSRAAILPVSISKPYRLFRKTIMTVGRPLELAELCDGRGLAASDWELTLDLMKRIYALQAYDYHLPESCDSVGKDEK